MAYKWGVTNYLLAGMILQAGGTIQKLLPLGLLEVLEQQRQTIQCSCCWQDLWQDSVVSLRWSGLLVYLFFLLREYYYNLFWYKESRILCCYIQHALFGTVCISSQAQLRHQKWPNSDWTHQLAEILFCLI